MWPSSRPSKCSHRTTCSQNWKSLSVLVPACETLPGAASMVPPHSKAQLHHPPAQITAPSPVARPLPWQQILWPSRLGRCQPLGIVAGRDPRDQPGEEGRHSARCP